MEHQLRHAKMKNENEEEECSNNVPPPFFDYRMEYARRHTLDSTLSKRLTTLVSHSQSFEEREDILREYNDETWVKLLQDGLDVVDELCEIYDTLNNDDEEEEETEKKKKYWIKKVLVGIHRSNLVMQWKNLILQDRYWNSEKRLDRRLGLKRGKKEGERAVRIEDGAIVLSQFYLSAKDLLKARAQLVQKQRTKQQDCEKTSTAAAAAAVKKEKNKKKEWRITLGTIVQEEIEKELDILANILKKRLHNRQNSQKHKTASKDDDDDDCFEYPMSWILEEMKYFFTEEEVEGADDAVNTEREERQRRRNFDGNDPFADIGDIIHHNMTGGTATTTTTTTTATSNSTTEEAAATTSSLSSPSPFFRPFSGNKTNYYTHTNSLLHHILRKSRKGIPITLCIIYISIVRRATGILLDPIGLPGHFILSTPPPSSYTKGGEHRIFIDPFRGGKLLTLSECQSMVMSTGSVSIWQEEFVHPVPYEEVWQRMVRNLLHCHSMTLWGGGVVGMEDEEGAFLKKVSLPLRFLLTDVLFRATSSSSLSSSSSSSLMTSSSFLSSSDAGGEEEDEEGLDTLIKSPALNSRFC